MLPELVLCQFGSSMDCLYELFAPHHKHNESYKNLHHGKDTIMVRIQNGTIVQPVGNLKGFLSSFPATNSPQNFRFGESSRRLASAEDMGAKSESCDMLRFAKVRVQKKGERAKERKKQSERPRPRQIQTETSRQREREREKEGRDRREKGETREKIYQRAIERERERD